VEEEEDFEEREGYFEEIFE
jgi:hypothetical protein